MIWNLEISDVKELMLKGKWWWIIVLGKKEKSVVVRRRLFAWQAWEWEEGRRKGVGPLILQIYIYMLSKGSIFMATCDALPTWHPQPHYSKGPLPFTLHCPFFFSLLSFLPSLPLYLLSTLLPPLSLFNFQKKSYLFDIVILSLRYLLDWRSYQLVEILVTLCLVSVKNLIGDFVGVL